MVDRLAPTVVRSAAVIRKSGLWDMVLIGVAFVLYYLVWGAVVERAGEATSRAIRLVELEKSLGLFWEGQMQAWVMSSDIAVKVFNGVYVWAHFPLVAAIGLWLFFLHRRQFIVFRNAFLISGGIGLILFNLFPSSKKVLLRAFGVVMVVAGTAVALFGLWAAVMLDRHGYRVWKLVVPPSLRRAQA